MPKNFFSVNQLYTFLLCFIAAGMANLNILMSIGTILLFALWLFSPGLPSRFQALRANRVAIILIGLFFLHIVWLWNTSDFGYAFKDIRIKLPLIIFGLVLGSISLTRSQFKYIFLSLGVGIWIASFVGYYNFVSSETSIINHRGIVAGISHIRLSMMMVLLVAAMFHFWQEVSMRWKSVMIVTLLNIILFFNIIQAASGIVVLAGLLVFSLIYYTRSSVRASVRRSTLIGVGILLILGIIGTHQYYQHYFVAPADALDDLPAQTDSGNSYIHLTDAGYVENGSYIFVCLAEDEMIDAWNERSDMKINPASGQHANLTAALTRYLTSLGLCKDRAGIMALSEKDIRNVEKGYPSILYVQKSGLALRYHTFLFGIHQYAVGGNASGISFMQRLVYWKAALRLIEKAPFLGTGTGDVKTAFVDVYEEMDTNLEPQYRNRAHNQFLTFFVSFGIFGFLYFVALFLYPVIFMKPGYLVQAFLFIAFLACLTEDMLETQAGVTFFTFYYAVLILSNGNSLRSARSDKHIGI